MIWNQGKYSLKRRFLESPARVGGGAPARTQACWLSTQPVFPLHLQLLKLKLTNGYDVKDKGNQLTQSKSPCFTWGKGPISRNFSVPTAAAAASDCWRWIWPRTVRSSKAEPSSRLNDWPAFLKDRGTSGVGGGGKIGRNATPHRGHGRPAIFEPRPQALEGQGEAQPVRGVAWKRARLRGHEPSPATSKGHRGDAEAGEGTRASSTAQRARRRAGRGPPAAVGSGSVTHILTAAAATRKHQPGTKTRRGTGRGEDKWGKKTASARTREEGSHFRGKHCSRESSSVPPTHQAFCTHA